MSVGLLGGAFDPPHNGHRALAVAAISHFELERLLVVVTGTPPHKDVETDAETRFRLAERAFAGLPSVELSRYELDRDGPSYTVDTARWAASQHDDVVLLVGADQLASFLAWRSPDEILGYVRLGVAARPGYEKEALDRVLERLRRPDRVEFFAIPEIDVSSSGVRLLVAAGASVDGLVPAGVGELIAELGLYTGRSGGAKPPST